MDRNGSRNGHPTPEERREQHLREDRRLKREVDEALKEWDRLDDDAAPSQPAPAPAER
jgi:hypothetical protein